MQTIGDALIAETPLARLLRDSLDIGGIYDFGYHEARVITNDEWTDRANGIPRHCFLLAYPEHVRPGVDGSRGNAEELDGRMPGRELVLLRVAAESPLPNQADLIRLRAEDADRRTTRTYQERPTIDRTDPATRALMQQAAFRCAVLGTFSEDAASGMLAFGKDIDTVYAAGRYRVAKPYGASLQMIVDYFDSPVADEPGAEDNVSIGTLRYASTRRRETAARLNGRSTAADIKIRPADFVAHKTAVFGMTRAGKSNTTKVIAASVYLHAHRIGLRIGQLIFDPAGEYAYANRQDGTALSQLGDDVRIYRLGATAADIAQRVRPLSLDFFDPDFVSACWSLINTYWRHDDARYIQNYLVADLDQETVEGDDRHNYRLAAARAFQFACLLNAGLPQGRHRTFRLPTNRHTLDWLAGDQRIGRLTSDQRDRLWGVDLDRPTLIAACRRIVDGISLINPNANDGDNVQRGRSTVTHADGTTPWTYGDLREALKHYLPQALGGTGMSGIDGITKLFEAKGHQGYKILQPMRDYHSADARVDYAKSIYADLALGRLVIVDLSRGSEQVLQTCAERVVGVLLGEAGSRFRAGKQPRLMQVFLEEAHNLLNRDKFNKATGDKDPYVRLARESAKFKIGLIYATQEVSAVDESILSNTANWVAAYMNNANEVKKLTQYYDFDAFGEQILTADDKGFIRLRTASCPFTLPVQVRKFDLDLVNGTRAELGRPPVDPSDNFAPGDVAEGDDLSDVVDPDAIYDSAAESPDFPSPTDSMLDF
jgi:hypothetical protein